MSRSGMSFGGKLTAFRLIFINRFLKASKKSGKINESDHISMHTICHMRCVWASSILSAQGLLWTRKAASSDCSACKFSFRKSEIHVQGSFGSIRSENSGRAGTKGVQQSNVLQLL